MVMFRVHFGVQSLSGDLHCVVRNFVSRWEKKRRGRDSPSNAVTRHSSECSKRTTRRVRNPCGAGWSGGAGIRTLKSVRTPVFETGALPFCHPSEGSCSIGPCHAVGSDA